MYKRGNSMVRGYLRTDGRYIRNEENEIVILRGFAAGSWMNPEGYMVSGVGGMFGFTTMEDKLLYNIRYDRGRTMNTAIIELCGTKYAWRFWPKWFRNQLAEDDIREMAALGFNSIRLPLDASALLCEEPGFQYNEDSFQMLDDVINWCEKYRLYAILDLHGAPGGQSGVSCDNGLDNVPHLFQEKESWERTAVLWETLAERYKDRDIVAGYELLNEPISTPQWHYLKAELRRFYDEVIARIRKIDQKHIIFLQGASFAHDSDIFDENIDPQCHNWCMSFHEHDIRPDMKTIYTWLEASFRLNVPVWYGEGSGKENDLAFMLDMLEDLGVGYNYFSWKAMDERQHRGKEVYTFPMPKRWDEIIAYIAEKGPRPGYQESQQIFDELLECCLLKNCRMSRPELPRYMLKKQGICLPGVLYDSVYKSGESFSSWWKYGNPFSFRTEDGTKLVMKPDGKMPGLFDGEESGPNPVKELWLELAEEQYVSYTIYDVKECCKVRVLVSASEDAVLETGSAGIKCETAVKAAAEVKEYETVELSPGNRHTVTLKVKSGKLRILSVQF